MGILVAIVAILASTFGVFFIVYHAIKAENTEKLALIEKGMDPLLLKKTSTDLKTVLKNGIFITGIGVGIIIGYILTLIIPIQAYVCYPAMILLFGGLSLITYYFIEKKNKSKLNDPE